MSIIFHTHPRHPKNPFVLEHQHKGHFQNPLISSHSKQIIKIFKLSKGALVSRVLANKMFLGVEVNLDMEVILQVDRMLL